MDNINLIGFMGAGKTTVGRKLAHLMHRSFFDTDEMIEVARNMTPAEIFNQEGLATFRLYETKALKDAQIAEGSVVATGGGIVESPQNRALLDRPDDKVIYLANSFGASMERLQGGAPIRPLLQQKTVAEVADMYAERKPYYEELADIVIYTDEMTTDEVVSEIVARLELDAGVERD